MQLADTFRNGDEFSDRMADAFSKNLANCFSDETGKINRAILFMLLLSGLVCGGFIEPSDSQNLAGMAAAISLRVLLGTMIAIQIGLLLISGGRMYAEWSVWSFNSKTNAWKIALLNDELNRRMVEITCHRKELVAAVDASLGTPTAISASEALVRFDDSPALALHKQLESDFSGSLVVINRLRKLRVWFEALFPVACGLASVVICVAFLSLAIG